MRRLLRVAAFSALAITTTLAGIAPAVATSRAAKSPPVITPAQARAVLAHYGTAIARANATLDRKLQATLEDGPALADDDFLFVNLKRAGLSMPQASLLMSAQVYVPSQSSYPAYFVGVEQRSNNTGMLLFRQTSQGGPWKVILYANADPTTSSVPDIALDSHGYAQLAASRSLAVAPNRLGVNTCQNVRDSQQGNIGNDVGLSGYTQSFLDLSQQAQQSNQTASSRCVPQAAPLFALATNTGPDGGPGGAFVMYAVRTSLILTGTRSNPIVVTVPPPGQSDVFKPGRYVQTNLTGFNMLGATVLAASDPNISTSQPPIDLPFGYGANAVVSATSAGSSTPTQNRAAPSRLSTGSGQQQTSNTTSSGISDNLCQTCDPTCQLYNEFLYGPAGSMNPYAVPPPGGGALLPGTCPSGTGK